MADDNVQWLVKNKDGQIDGPFTTVEIIQKIRAGYYQGEESISYYPSGKWHAISYEEDFFNELLETLEDELNDDQSRVFIPPAVERKPKRDVKVEKDDGQSAGRRQWGDEIVPDEIFEKTPVFMDIKPKETAKIRLKEKAKRGRAVDESKPEASAAQKKSKKASRRNTPGKKAKSRNQRSKQKRFRFFVAALIGFIVWLVVSTDSDSQRSREGIQLLAPRMKSANTGKTKRANIKRAIAFFRRDTVNDYIKAQNTLVAAVEKTNSLDAYAFLCMTYRELWPISRQNSKDLQTVQTVLREVQKIDPKSVSAITCLVVNEWVSGRYEDAMRIMDAQLREQPGLIFFNQMSGDIYASRREYDTAAYYFAKVRELWNPPPVWAKTLIQEARMYRRLRKYGRAISLYRNLLEAYPRHAVGQIEKGILEFVAYQHIQKAKDHITSGLNYRQQIAKNIEAEAYLVLSKINAMQGDRRRALRNAQKAFSIDSTNQDARKFIVSMGGLKALNAIEIDNINMVYVGEQFMKMGNYAKAQAQFRAAYEANPTNAFSALRAGQALWRLNQSNEAITWVQKSVLADPRLIRSYIVLSDYLSQRYDYINAVAALKQARRINKRHHEVWRGFALVELRRRNYQGAINFAEKALKLYDTDIEAILILAKAHKGLQNRDKAYQHIQRATELDYSHEEVQATYAKILADIQGPSAGESYVQNLINQVPNKIIYRRTKAEIYIQEDRFDAAIEVCSDILAMDSKDKKTLMMMARVLQLKQRRESYDSAREYLMEAASLDPSDAEPLFQLGELYLEAGQASFALQQFERVIQVNPKYPLSHLMSGKALLKMGKQKEALELAMKERRLNPEIPESYLLAGEAYFKMSIRAKDSQVAYAHAEACANEYRKAVGKGYRYADGYIWLARCLRLSGDLEGAEAMLDEAEKLESGNPDIYRESGALYEMRGDNQKAAFWYRKYLKLNPQAKDSAEINIRIQNLSR